MAHLWDRFPRGGFSITTLPLTRQWSQPPVYLAASYTAWCPSAQTFALFPSFLLPRALLCHLPEVNNETMCLLSGNLGFQVLLLLGGPGQLSITLLQLSSIAKLALKWDLF